MKIETIGKARYAIIENGIFGTRIVSGIITGVRYTEGNPVYEIKIQYEK